MNQMQHVAVGEVKCSCHASCEKACTLEGELFLWAIGSAGLADKIRWQKNQLKMV